MYGGVGGGRVTFQPIFTLPPTNHSMLAIRVIGESGGARHSVLVTNIYDDCLLVKGGIVSWGVSVEGTKEHFGFPTGLLILVFRTAMARDSTTSSVLLLFGFIVPIKSGDLGIGRKVQPSLAGVGFQTTLSFL